MKKLLALILCVMMFVSVIPTMAFATDEAAAYQYGDEAFATPTTIPLESASAYKTMIKNLVDNTRDNIQFAYKVLAGDQVVYAAAKSMDESVVGLVDGLANTLIEKGKMNKAAADNVKFNMRRLVDGLVAAKITENLYKALDSDGDVDPLKYAQLVANSVNDVLTDKDFQKGYETVATFFALANLVSDVNDELKDQRDAFLETINSTFDEKFAERYPTLASPLFADGTPYITSIAMLNADLADAIDPNASLEENAAAILKVYDKTNEYALPAAAAVGSWS